MYELKNGTKRLAWALYCHADERTRAELARLLNYMPQQLDEDIQALHDYIHETEQKEQDKEQN